MLLLLILILTNFFRYLKKVFYNKLILTHGRAKVTILWEVGLLAAVLYALQEIDDLIPSHQVLRVSNRQSFPGLSACFKDLPRGTKKAALYGLLFVSGEGGI